MTNYDEATDLLTSIEADRYDQDHALTRAEWIAVAQTRAHLAVADALQAVADAVRDAR